MPAHVSMFSKLDKPLHKCKVMVFLTLEIRLEKRIGAREVGKDFDYHTTVSLFLFSLQIMGWIEERLEHHKF